MKKDKQLDNIKLHFGTQPWFDHVYPTTYKNEYVIVVNRYPYTKDHLFFDYEKTNNVRIRIHTMGGK